MSRFLTNKGLIGTLTVIERKQIDEIIIYLENERKKRENNIICIRKHSLPKTFALSPLFYIIMIS